MGDAGTCDSLPEFNRKKVSPRKQSSCWGCRMFLAKGFGWQHHSSTKTLQFSLGRERTLRNFLRRRKKKIFQYILFFSKTLNEYLGSLQKGRGSMAFSQNAVIDSPFIQSTVFGWILWKQWLNASCQVCDEAFPKGESPMIIRQNLAQSSFEINHMAKIKQFYPVTKNITMGILQLYLLLLLVKFPCTKCWYRNNRNRLLAQQGRGCPLKSLKVRYQILKKLNPDKKTTVYFH